jgi:capsule polysaccharide export protein KpsC/LpsZ
VYVPLHTLPESSTLTLSTEYYEADLVRFMAKELPATVDIVVKENPNMIGTRPFAYYETLATIPNVHLLDPTVQSKRLIREARGVCGISGTALLEAAMLETPTHHFGSPEFEAVLDYEGHEEFSQFASACAEGRASRNPERVERYVQYVMNEGREIPLTSIRTDPGSKAWKNGTRTVYELFEPSAREALA